jgi:hypothetical protein
MNARRNIIGICLFCYGIFFVFIHPYLDTHFLLFKNIQSSANVFFGSNILKDNFRVCNGDFGIFIPTFRFMIDTRWFLHSYSIFWKNVDRCEMKSFSLSKKGVEYMALNPKYECWDKWIYFVS